MMFLLQERLRSGFSKFCICYSKLQTCPPFESIFSHLPSVQVYKGPFKEMYPMILLVKTAKYIDLVPNKLNHIKYFQDYQK